MNIRRTVPGLLLALLLISGCGKPGSGVTSSPPNASMLSPDTVVRVHWLGKNKVQLRMGSFFLMRLWRLDESAALQSQTVSRLAAAPSRWFKVTPDKARLATPLLKTTLNDMVMNECYLEVRRPANQPAELAFAIHLDAEHVGLWETNTANIIGLLTGTWPKPLAHGVHGWSLHRESAPRLLEFRRDGDWAVFGVGPESNALFDEIRGRVRHYSDPFAAQAATNWFVADLKLNRLPEPLAALWHLSTNSPDLSLAVNGNGANVLTYARLIFPEPLHLDFEPWTPPVNLIHEPLNSFTAVRGFKPWLSSSKIWHELPLSAPPDQLYCWSLPGKASQFYFAAPLPDARNQVSRLSEHLMTKTDPWLAARGYVSFQRLPDSNGVRWGNMADIQPFLKYADAAGGVLFGGFLLNTEPGANVHDNLYDRPPLAELVHRILAQTNLIYYGWEVTGTRIEPCLYLGQVARVVSRHVELPAGSASLNWLRVLQPRLGPCTTTVTRTGPNQLSFFRSSTVGFTGAELQLLADWLESPQFPFGLYSLLTPPAAK